MAQLVFTVKQLAERWNVTRSYIYKQISEGKLKSFPAGGTLKRITIEEVERWEAGGENLPSSLTASETTGSDGSSINSALSGIPMGKGTVTDLALKRKKRREQNFMRSRGRTKN